MNEKAHRSGASLEAALRDYGPAAIEDLLPRLRAIAETLDQAHAAGQVHGSLHPVNIFISAETTQVTGLGEAIGAPSRRPYGAPEIVAGGAARPASDQFALAAITFEWLFGRRISGPAERPVEVRSLPRVDRAAMAKAFTRALAPEAAGRFASCAAFADALGAAIIPGLPLGGEDEADEVVEAFTPAARDEASADPLFDFNLPAEEPSFAALEPRLSPPVEAVSNWQPGASYTPPKPVERFGGGMLIAACLVCMVVGFAAGYMARPRALQSGPVQTMATPPSETERANAPAPVAPGTKAPEAPTPAPQAPEAPQAPVPAVPSNVGRLLIRSTPSGAAVQVNGVAMGVTPLTLRDLELGSRTIVVARRGHESEERRVVLTAARPSQSLEIRLSAGAAAPQAATRPAGVATGVLVVESRPPGAIVTINGRPSGTTPATIAALAPGDYRVSLSLAGYQPFATTVRVVAGERTRAAASLSVQE